MVSRIKYDRKLLEQVCERDKCIIDFDKIETYNQNAKINFICKCTKSYIKTFRQIYEKSRAYCRECTAKIRQDKRKQTCLAKYGVDNHNKCKYIQDKRKQTCLKKYGVEHNSQSQQIKQKKLNTCMEKYGVENVFKLEETKEKSKKTCIDKYGLPFSNQVPQIKEKSKQTCIHKYGTENPFQSNIIKTKIKQTCLEKYGVENPSQNSKISEKQSKSPYKLREYIFSCGNTIQVQGYEPYLLDILVKEGYVFEDIITKRTEVPEIWYNKNDKKCRYYCDVYIPKTNTIYEVKSTWTYKKDIEDIPLKKQACIDAGYNFELYVFDSKGVKQLLD